MEAYFPTPISSEPAVDDKGIVGWMLESLHTVPARLVSVFRCQICRTQIVKLSRKRKGRADHVMF